ncbi:MAG: tetratricopeptide repeat protein [Nitrospinaceae bacterium]|nr:tetratricopeptide repeat protein [Nitrospinaceae bacterium]
MKFVIRPYVKLSLLYFMVLFLTVCGDGGGPKLISEANNEWIKGRNQSAVEIFKTILKKYPSTPSAQEALFRLGEIYHLSLDNSEQAIVYFQEVIAMDKAGAHNFDAQKYIAEIMEFTFKDLDQSIIEYQNLINKFDQPQEKSDHQYRIASIYFKKRNYGQALVEFEVLLEKYPKSPRAEEAQFKILEILYTLKRCSEVRRYYDDFIEGFSSSKYQGEMKFVVASCLEEEGMLKEAFDMFASLEDNYAYPALLQIKLEGIKQRIRKKK